MKVYENLEQIFEDGIFGPTEIIVLWGKRGRGKSSLAGMFMSEFMRPKIAKNDIKQSNIICNNLRQAGYNIRPPQDHTVFCDTFFERKGFGRKRRTAYRFNAIGFGLPNSTHPTDLLCPGGRYFFDEAQDLFDSHRASLPTFVTKAIELSRQIKLFLCIIAQRPKRIHIDIRELAIFIEVVGVKLCLNKYSRITACVWECNIIYDNATLEQYLTTRDKSLVDKHIYFRFKGNIFKCFDTSYFLPMYYRNMENQSLVLEKTQRTEYNQAFFKEYFKSRVIDIPDTYLGKNRKNKETIDYGN